MELRAWRKAHRKTLADLAQDLGLSGRNPSRTVQRIELGRHKIDLLTAFRIVEVTSGGVSLHDLAQVRRDYVAANGDPESAGECVR